MSCGLNLYGNFTANFGTAFNIFQVSFFTFLGLARNVISV